MPMPTTMKTGRDSDMATHYLYFTATAADIAWHTALVRAYGTAAGDARYDARGTATDELRTLHTRYVQAMDAWRPHARTMLVAAGQNTERIGR